MEGGRKVNNKKRPNEADIDRERERIMEKA